MKQTVKANLYMGESIGFREVDIVVEINLEEVARQLAYRARKNKNGKATALDGAIVVKFAK